jgi:DNA-binding beta-propeller fold protein YncE
MAGCPRSGALRRLWRGALVTVLACGGDSTGPEPAPQVVVSPDFVDLVLGASRQLAVTVLDENGQPVAAPTLAFESTDTARVAVSAAGLLTARSPGEATVTVTSGPARAYASARAHSPPVVALSPDSAQASVGDTILFTAVARDFAGVVVPDAPVTYESSNPTVLQVIGPGGRSRALAPGNARLRARSGTTADSARVAVYGLPAQVTVTPDSLRLLVADDAPLSVVVRDATGQVIPNAPRTFASGDTTVARVSGSGVVRAVGIGLTSVTATAGAASASIPIVGAALIELLPASLVLEAGDTVQLDAVARDSLGAEIPGVAFTFQSTDPTVAQVSAAGQVTVTGVGSARIIAAGGYDRDTTEVVALLARTPVPGRPFGIAASASDVYVTQLDAAAVTRLDPAGGDSIGAIGVGTAPTDVIFNAAATRAYVTNQLSQSVSEIDPATDTELRRLPIPADAYIVALAPGDSILYVSANSARAYVIRLATGAIIDSLPTGISYALTVRDTLLYVGLPLDGRVDVYDRRTRDVVRSFATGGRPAGMALSAAGSTLYVADEYGGLQRWNTLTGTFLGTVALTPAGAFGVAVHPATGIVFVTGMSGVTHVVDPVAGTVLRTLALGGSTRRVAFRANGDAFVANEAGWVDVVR